MATAAQVARYFIANADLDEGITNLKLQKLCAYAQAFALALLNKNLFDEEIEAWTHGPVIRSLYEIYPIVSNVTKEEARQPFTNEELYVLETVNGYYGEYSAWALRDMSHNDFPGDFNSVTRSVIPKNDIKVKFNNNKVIQTIISEL